MTRPANGEQAPSSTAGRKSNVPQMSRRRPSSSSSARCTVFPTIKPPRSRETSHEGEIEDDAIAPGEAPPSPRQLERRLQQTNNAAGYVQQPSTPSQVLGEARAATHMSNSAPVDSDVPETDANLGKVVNMSPVPNVDHNAVCAYASLKQVRSREQEYIRASSRGGESMPEQQQSRPAQNKEWHLATHMYTVSYLVFFALLGTLARLGLAALAASYPGAPFMFPSLWPNFAGSLIMGFLLEDRMLFRYESGLPTHIFEHCSGGEPRWESGVGSAVDAATAKKALAAAKKTIPLYVGLATGFCGSFTSFSSFIRDLFLAMSNDLTDPSMSAGAAIPPRSGGDSLMAVLAVLLTTVSLGLAAFFIGAHLAIFVEPLTPSLPLLLIRKGLDRLVIPLGWGCWVGAVAMAIRPPFDAWRGQALFALVFSPLGCLARFYASLYMNGRVARFPCGTFAVNAAGSTVLAVMWTLAHLPVGGVLGCQVLQGVEDGFCGCLTTVSTWVAELTAMRRADAYLYGAVSVVVSLGMVVAIMGGVRWSLGFEALLCEH